MQPQLHSLETNLTVSVLRENPHLVQEWADTVPNWSLVDGDVNKTMDAGIIPIVEIGEVLSVGGCPFALVVGSTHAK